MNCDTCIFGKADDKCIAPRNVTPANYDCDPVDRQAVIDSGECRPLTLDEVRKAFTEKRNM